MSKYFAFVEGVPHDFKFKKLSDAHPFDYSFHLGETSIGCIGKSGTRNDNSWVCMVYGDEYTYKHKIPTLVYGFVSRHRAIDYMLMVHPLTKDTYMRKD